MFSLFFYTTELLISNFLFKFLTFLKRLHYNQNSRCEICCQKSESVGHILWECPLARNVWAICQGKIQKCPNDAIGNSLLCSGCLVIGYHSWSWIDGRQYHAHYGMLEINIILNMFSNILE